MKRWCVMLTVVVGAAAVLGGCQKPLFVDDTARTQYDRYARLRGQNRPMTRPNAYGVDEPALRQRLAPLEQPD